MIVYVNIGQWFSSINDLGVPCVHTRGEHAEFDGFIHGRAMPSEISFRTVMATALV